MIALIKKIYHGIDRALQAACRILPESLYRLVVRLHRMLTYGFMGCINTAVDYLVFSLLYLWIGAPIEWSQAAGVLTAAAHGYMLNSNLTFTEGKRRTRVQLIQYVGVDVILTILSSYFMRWIESINAPVFLVKLGVTVAVGLIHYVVYKSLVFRIKKEDKQ